MKSKKERAKHYLGSLWHYFEIHLMHRPQKHKRCSSMWLSESDVSDDIEADGFKADGNKVQVGHMVRKTLTAIYFLNNPGP